MGQALSQHEVYGRQLKETLNIRGVKVKTNDSFKYSDFVKDFAHGFIKSKLLIL